MPLLISVSNSGRDSQSCLLWATGDAALRTRETGLDAQKSMRIIGNPTLGGFPAMGSAIESAHLGSERGGASCTWYAQNAVEGSSGASR